MGQTEMGAKGPVAHGLQALRCLTSPAYGMTSPEAARGKLLIATPRTRDTPPAFYPPPPRSFSRGGDRAQVGPSTITPTPPGHSDWLKSGRDVLPWSGEKSSFLFLMAKLRRCENKAANSHIPHHVGEAILQQENAVNMPRKQTRESCWASSPCLGFRPQVSL